MTPNLTEIQEHNRQVVKRVPWVYATAFVTPWLWLLKLHTLSAAELHTLSAAELCLFLRGRPTFCRRLTSAYFATRNYVYGSLGIYLSAESRLWFMTLPRNYGWDTFFRDHRSECLYIIGRYNHSPALDVFLWVGCNRASDQPDVPDAARRRRISVT